MADLADMTMISRRSFIKGVIASGAVVYSAGYANQPAGSVVRPASSSHMPGARQVRTSH